MSPQLSVSTTKHSAFWNRLSSHSLSSRSLSYVTIASSILFLLALVFVPELLSSPSFADEPITVNPSITIGNSGVLSLAVNPGQFASTSQDVVVTTSNYTGYTMTIAPSSGSNTDLEHTAVSNVTIPTITPTAPATSITSSDFSNLNTAAYGLSIDDGANYIPVENGSTIKTTSTATDATTGSFSLTLGAKTLTDTPAGSYIKSFNLTAVANAASYSITYDKNLNGESDTITSSTFPTTNEGTLSGTELILSSKIPVRTGYKFLHWNTEANDTGTSYSVSGIVNLDPETSNPIVLYAIWGCGDGYICYHENGADGGQGTMKHTTLQPGAYSAGSTHTLIAPNYSKTGYGFVGWSTEPIDPTKSTAAIKADITSLAAQNKIYGPNQDITMPNPTEPVNLYAVWLRAETDGNDNPVYLQGWNGCSSMSDGEVKVLTDSRDNEVYTIVKIEKNKGQSNEYSQCWMTENLRLDVANQNITYTNANTNHPASSFLAQKDVFSGDTWQTCTENSVACDDQISYSLVNIDRNNPASHNTNNQTSSWYSYGGYYNWFTATAGNGTYSKSSDSVDGSLCPSGWNLPSVIEATSDFGKLDIALGGTGESQSSTVASNRWRAYPVNFLFSGDISNTSATSRGSTGYYWNATVYSTNFARFLILSSSRVLPDTINGVGKYGGRSIRCFAGNIWSIHFDANTTDSVSGTMDDQFVPQGESAALGPNTFQRPVSGTTGYRFTGWNTQANGSGISYADDATVPAQTVGTQLTLYAQWEEVTVMAISYQGNGLSFADSSASNAAYYYNSCGNVTVGTSPQYSHTPNLLDNGERNTSYNGASVSGSTAGNYANSYTKNEVITIPNATKLHIRLTYAGESATYDWVSIWSGKHTGYTAASDFNASEKVLLGGNTTNKYGGGSGTTVEGDVTGTDTITFAFKSDGSGVGNGYGYYAVVTALDANGNTLNTGDANYICTRSLISGEYKEPVVSNTQEFLGWSEHQNTTTADYVNVTDVLNNLPGNNGETKTLYAIWRNLYVIHFNGNGSTSGSMTDQKIPVDTSANLTSNSFSRTGYKFIGWSENQNATTATYANSASFTAPSTSGETTLYAIWQPQLKIIYHANYEGSSSTYTQWIAAGESSTLASSTRFTRTGFKIDRWDTASTGDGTPYAVSSSYTAPVDTQAGDELHLYAVWTVAYTIVYNANGGEGAMSLSHTNVAEGDSINLYASNFSSATSGGNQLYGFAGWSPVQLDPTSNTFSSDLSNAVSSGIVYGPNETISAPSYNDYGSEINGARTITLYAIWVPAEKDGNNNPVYLQGWNSCSSLDPNEVIALTDSRDNSVYAIARIVDNASNPTYSQCWMIENLRLDVTDPNITYTNNNTNHPASSFLAQKDAFSSGDPTWQMCTDNSIACVDQISYSLANINRTNTANYSASNQTSSWYSYGGMYNEFTATAGNGLYGMSTGNTSTVGDLCPNGWRLPIGGTSTTTDFKSLNIAINSGSTNIDTGLRSYPANFLRSGHYERSSAVSRGGTGYYWSSTAHVVGSGYSLYFHGSNVSTGNYNIKYRGLALRCLAGNPNYYIIYDANGGTGYGDPQSLGTTAPDGATTTTLTASNFKKTGYGFAGWSRNPNADPNGVNAATEIYGPNATITVPDSTNFDSNKNLTLYAIWVPLAKDSNGNDLTFQTTSLLTTTLSDNSTLDSKSNGYVTALKDTRDNEVYAVAKLADGNYWMIENMRLDLSSNNTTITTSNTNHPTAAFVTDINDNYKGKANDPNTTLWKTCTDSTSACIDQTSFAINNLDRQSVSPITTAPKYEYQNYGWYSYGVHYNWYTATGGTGTYSKTYGVTDGDLCPMGWHLPKGGISGEFSRLNAIVNNGSTSISIGLRAYPVNLIFSGSYYGSSAKVRGGIGYYWSSSTTSSASIADDMTFAGNVFPGNAGATRYDGEPIRCLINNL